MIGSAYAQASSIENLEFYSINSPEVINIDTFDFQTTVSMDVTSYNFSDEGNLTYEWSYEKNGSSPIGTVTILSENEKQTNVRFGGGSGYSISGTLFCKVTDSGLATEYTSETTFIVSFN